MRDQGTFVVLDNGSGVLKIGYAGFETPTFIPTVVGQIKQVKVSQPSTRETNRDYLYLGPDAEMRKASVGLQYPMSRGFVTDWSDMVELWNYTFGQIGMSKDEALPTLITEPPKWPMSQRAQTAEIMYENFKVPSLCFVSTAVLNLLSKGLNTGVSLDIGEGITSAVAVYKGKEVARSIQRMDFAGRDMAKFLMRTLELNMKNHWPGYEGRRRTSNRASIRHYVMEAMVKYCHVAQDLKEEMQKKPKVCEFRLPNGKGITMEKEAFTCPEALFRPEFVGLSTGGIHQMTRKAIESCDKKLQEKLYRNIVLCGGISQLPGLLPRLQKEISALAPEQVSVNITGPLLDSAWKGGSCLAATTLFRERLISKSDYDEAGTNAFLPKDSIPN